MTEKIRDQLEIIEEVLQDSQDKKYVLRLYVAGSTPRSTAAILGIKNICEEYLKGRYELEVIDLYQQPTLARGEQIVAVPTLIKKLPLPLRRFIGNMGDVDRILVGLDLKPKDEAKPKDDKK